MKKLKCNQGNYQCGGKCQPNVNECPTEIDSGKGGQIDAYTEIIESTQSKLSNTLTETQKNIPEVKELLDSYGLGTFFKYLKNNDFDDADINDKIDRFIDKYGLDEDEAIAVATWISDDYSIFNEPALKNKKPKKDVQEKINNLNRALESGKLPSYSIDNMLKLAGEISPESANIIRNDGLLVRGLDLSAAKAKKVFLSYKEKIGDTVTDNTFFASTALKDGELPFIQEDKFLIYVKPKENGNGKLVDYGKNELFEGEVLYKQNTNFKVLSVNTEKLNYEQVLNKDELEKIKNSTTYKIIVDKLPKKSFDHNLSLMGAIGRNYPIVLNNDDPEKFINYLTNLYGFKYSTKDKDYYLEIFNLLKGVIGSEKDFVWDVGGIYDKYSDIIGKLLYRVYLEEV